jgi:hypothetical protein
VIRKCAKRDERVELKNREPPSDGNRLDQIARLYDLACIAVTTVSKIFLKRGLLHFFSKEAYFIFESNDQHSLRP